MRTPRATEKKAKDVFHWDIEIDLFFPCVVSFIFFLLFDVILLSPPVFSF